MVKQSFFIDRVHRLPRVWSNRELAKFAPLFKGDVVNVSAWQDRDKEGGCYRDYFINASSYTITNYKNEARGFQGGEGEIFLDLEQDLPPELKGAFDVVFNHTTLEHIYNIKKAFKNLCLMSRDIVIVVVPFLQQYHSDYGDYWRFSPLAIKRMFEENNFAVLYLSFNNHKRASVYIFAIGTRKLEKWQDKFPCTVSYEDPEAKGPEPFIGAQAIGNIKYRFKRRLKKIF